MGASGEIPLFNPGEMDVLLLELKDSAQLWSWLLVFVLMVVLLHCQHH